MAIKAGNIIIGNQSVSSEADAEIKIENKIVQMEEGTVVHNGKPKRFNKNMSAYMIDMLTSEE
jgi:ABC-type arginine transport system ATPase subunit